MSGAGRKSAYRKSVTEEVLNSFPEPDREAGERVARVVQSRGGNILQVRASFIHRAWLGLIRAAVRTVDAPVCVACGCVHHARTSDPPTDPRETHPSYTCLCLPVPRPPPTHVPTQVLVEDGEESLAILPTKYRKLIWVKRGDFVIVAGASHDFLTAAGDKGKVRFMVEHILYKDQVKHLKEAGLW